MLNFGKKIVWLFWVIVLRSWWIAFGQPTVVDDKPDSSSSKCNVDWAEKNDLWFGVCPTWTKEVDRVCKPCSDKWVCCGIELNTDVPFIGNCIEFGKKWEPAKAMGNETTVSQEEAFPKLMWWLMKILITIIILAGFVWILAWGVMISASGWSDESAGKGKKLIGRVIIAIAILGASGVILRLINPNFFQ